MVLQNAAWPHHPRCFHGQSVRSNSLFTVFQSKPTRGFQAFPKGWQVQNRIFGLRHSTSGFLIFMLDRGKDNGIQEDSTVKHNLHSMKETVRFDKEHHQGGQLHASDQQSLDEFPSTERFASDEDLSKQFTESSEQGTIKGAISLITGTSIGTGILALPATTAPAGFVPSALSMVICWGFLVIEALLLAEVNVALLRQRDPSHFKKCESEVISLCTMAEQTLGKWGGILSTIGYIFLSYTILVAYVAKSGEVLSILVNVPAPIAGALFTGIFGILVLVGGTNLTDKVNQLLTACLMGLFLLIVGAAPFLGGWSGVNHMDWNMVPRTIPVIIFSLVYHDLTPVICVYLGGNISRIRTSIILGSMVPLASFLIWDAVVLGVTSISGGEDPLDFLLRIGGSRGSYVVQVFSLFSVATSLIGTLLGLQEFFMEQLSNNTKIRALLGGHIRITPFFMGFSKAKQISRLLLSSSSYQACFGKSFTLMVTKGTKMASVINKWWMNNGLRVASFTLVILPPLVISTIVTDAFFTATDIAGSYGMMTLYGIFPPAMAWAFTKSNDKSASEKSSFFALPGGNFALAGIGFCACGVVLDQAFLDLSRISFPTIVDNDIITEIINAFSFLY